MVLMSKEGILELQQIIREDYGRELPLEDVSQMAYDLVGYFDLLQKLWHEMDDKTKAELNISIRE